MSSVPSASDMEKGEIETSMDLTMANDSKEGDNVRSTVFLQKHPLLIDTIIHHVIATWGDLSLKDTLACRAVCSQWRNHFQPKLCEIIENHQIVFRRDFSEQFQLPERSTLSIYQKPMAVGEFLRLRHNVVEPLPQIQFKRFTFNYFLNSQNESEFDETLIWEFFHEFGPSLLHLEFDLNLELEERTYRRILLSCPNLEQFVLGGMSGFWSEAEFQKASIEAHPKTSIKRLIFKHRGSFAELDSNFLKYYLMACPQLEILNLGRYYYSDECFKDIGLRNLLCSRALKELHLDIIRSPEALHPFISQFRLKSLSIEALAVNGREDVDKLLQPQSQSLQLLSIRRFWGSLKLLKDGEIISFPVMRNLRHLQLDLYKTPWEPLHFHPINFATTFPNLKTLAIGELSPYDAYRTNAADEDSGVESLEFQISVDNPPQVIMFLKNFQNLKVLEISVHLIKLPESQEVRKIWSYLENLESLYLHVKYICLNKYTLDEFFSGLFRDWDRRKLSKYCNAYLTCSDCPHCSCPKPRDMSQTILNLKRLKHLDIEFALDVTRSTSRICRSNRRSKDEFDMNIASFWAFTKLPALEYLKISGTSLYINQVAMLDIGLRLFDRISPPIKDYDEVDSYEWKIPGASYPPKKPSEFFELNSM